MTLQKEKSVSYYPCLSASHSCQGRLVTNTCFCWNALTCLRWHVSGRLVLILNSSFVRLLPHIKGNVGFVFTKEDLVEVRDMLLSNKVGLHIYMFKMMVHIIGVFVRPIMTYDASDGRR